MGRQQVGQGRLPRSVSTFLLVNAAIGKKKKKTEEIIPQNEPEAIQSASSPHSIVVFGFAFDHKIFFPLLYTILTIVIVKVTLTLTNPDSGKAPTKAAPKTRELVIEPPKPKNGNRPDTAGTLDVVLVGCGMPKKGMGWYHLTQLLEMKNVNVRAIVEPFFLNDELCPATPPAFAQLVASLESKGVMAVSSVDDLEKFEKPTLCLIAGRTPDNPKLFRQCVNKGASIIFLEKPGAPSVKELEEMRDLANERDVMVYIGYNKNVTPYVQSAVTLSRKTPNSQVSFVHNNSYDTSDLPECFTRNSEGMLKNMAIHELALLVTFFNVTVDTISDFKVDTSKEVSEKLTIWQPGTSMPDPVYITDFSRVKFEITTKNGTKVSVQANRCGGNVSRAEVRDSEGKELEQFEFPDAKKMEKVDAMVKADPEMMPYFFVQSDDYQELKDRVVGAHAKNVAGARAEGVATINVAIEALKLAEYGTEKLNTALEDVQT